MSKIILLIVFATVFGVMASLTPVQSATTDASFTVTSQLDETLSPSANDA